MTGGRAIYNSCQQQLQARALEMLMGAARPR